MAQYPNGELPSVISSSIDFSLYVSTFVEVSRLPVKPGLDEGSAKLEPGSHATTIQTKIDVSASRIKQLTQPMMFILMEMNTLYRLVLSAWHSWSQHMARRYILLGF